ncbi:hypothetical protein THAOC_32574 [Thalassiosira oceanica]|uniref:PHD-type domain-containing protein n=1 Tax=Thalassiosira oceanica TaxID=159749 RepID=K0R8Y8_THAOC|nr:hypothetical protein THAOC_32574 [Thalassiosira oceanica]|eukprot:EJK48614.1 hypothetical protein THAOC_32574 [Thalassiosira oceanica]
MLDGEYETAVAEADADELGDVSEVEDLEGFSDGVAGEDEGGDDDEEDEDGGSEAGETGEDEYGEDGGSDEDYTTDGTYDLDSSGSVIVCANEQDFLDQHNDYCEVCNQPGELLCCATCNLVYHKECVRPRLAKDPPDDWKCAYCVSSGVVGGKREGKERRRATNACREMERMKESIKAGTLDPPVGIIKLSDLNRADSDDGDGVRLAPQDVPLEDAAASGCRKCINELETGEKDRRMHDNQCPRKFGKRERNARMRLGRKGAAANKTGADDRIPKKKRKRDRPPLPSPRGRGRVPPRGGRRPRTTTTPSDDGGRPRVARGRRPRGLHQVPPRAGHRREDQEGALGRLSPEVPPAARRRGRAVATPGGAGQGRQASEEEGPAGRHVVYRREQRPRPAAQLRRAPREGGRVRLPEVPPRARDGREDEAEPRRTLSPQVEAQGGERREHQGGGRWRARRIGQVQAGDQARREEEEEEGPQGRTGEEAREGGRGEGERGRCGHRRRGGGEHARRGHRHRRRRAPPQEAQARQGPQAQARPEAVQHPSQRLALLERAPHRGVRPPPTREVRQRQRLDRDRRAHATEARGVRTVDRAGARQHVAPGQLEREAVLQEGREAERDQELRERQDRGLARGLQEEKMKGGFFAGRSEMERGGWYCLWILPPSYKDSRIWCQLAIMQFSHFMLCYSQEQINETIQSISVEVL